MPRRQGRRSKNVALLASRLGVFTPFYFGYLLITEVALILATFIHFYGDFDEIMGLAAFWSIFSQKHLDTLLLLIKEWLTQTAKLVRFSTGVGTFPISIGQTSKLSPISALQPTVL
jgi:hypothetical protein